MKNKLIFLLFTVVVTEMAIAEQTDPVQVPYPYCCKWQAYPMRCKNCTEPLPSSPAPPVTTQATTTTTTTTELPTTSDLPVEMTTPSEQISTTEPPIILLENCIDAHPLQVDCQNHVACLFVVEGKRDKFWQCVPGSNSQWVPLERPCAPGTMFSWIDQVCVW